MTEAKSRQPVERVSIIVSRGSLEGVYPGLIKANGACMEGIEASLFFTFFGLDAITNKRLDHLKVATIGNPAMHIPTVLGAIPGMSAFATHMMKKEIEKLNIPPVREFLQTIHDAGGEIYGCKASVDLFHLKKEDFTPLVDDIITVGEFYGKSAGAQIIFT
jgi:peroxiredoxin family protein